MDCQKIISFYIKNGFEKGFLSVVFPRGSGKMKAAEALAEEIDAAVCIAEFSDGKGRSKWGVLVDKTPNEELNKMKMESTGEKIEDDGDMQSN